MIEHDGFVAEPQSKVIKVHPDLRSQVVEVEEQKETINVGIIGYGYWGPNIVRNFSANSKFKVLKTCDVSEARLEEVKALYPDITTTRVVRDIFSCTKIDVVGIITPVFTHYELAKQALSNGKHVFIEKPLTATSAQAEELIDIAEKRNLLIMVDHTFLFTSAVQKMKELVENGTLGDLYYYDSVRVNLGLFQHDTNVIWDLAPHDISILNYLVKGMKPISVNAIGVGHFGSGLEDVAYLTVKFENNFIASFHVNWLSPVKIRHSLIAGNKKMMVWNDLLSDEKIKIYDAGVEVESKEGVYDLLVQYRSGDMWAPKLPNVEALKAETEYFADCIINGEKPINDAIAGLEVVRILEASEKSIKNNGQKVML